jgi:LysM repeat protein
MNFAFDSVKLKSKQQNEDFYFDIEMPRGHFFAVLDFASHDYANLNATLKGKLETIAGSFASLSDFSSELFLGFLAKEINNFVNNLAEQSGGPELLFSAALCLVSGNHLSYFRCGDVRINIIGSDGLQPLTAADSQSQLGARDLEAPLTDQTQAFTLQDADVVLIMTQGVAEAFESQPPADVMSLREADAKVICESLMKGSVAGREDRTLVVIGGPYVLGAAMLPDSSAVAELQASLASLEAKLEALTAGEQRKQSDVSSESAQLEQKFSQQIEILKDDLRSKAPAIDVLELDEKLKGLSASLASKADTAAMLGLQRDVLKLGLASNQDPSGAKGTAAALPLAVPVEATDVSAGNVTASPESPAELSSISSETATRQLAPSTPFNIKLALIVVAIALAAGFVGGWLQSRATKKGVEVWSVRTSGNQIVISRRDGSDRHDVTMQVAEPLKSDGEQTFSSFADVKQYIDTITSKAAQPTETNQSNQSTPSTDAQSSATVSEITVKQGDTLKKLSQVHNVPPEKLMELNPGITRWPAIRIGQKIVVPAAGSSEATSLPPQPEPSPANQFPANTTEVRVAPGDSLNQLARRFNTTAERIKELNPQITNWLRIQRGQKVVVPAPAGG